MEKVDNFNYSLFGKKVRLIDSENEGQSNVAIGQALKQCRDHDPPVRFYEAVLEAFPREDAAAAEEIAELREKLDTLEANAAQLGKKYIEAEQKIKGLQAERARHKHERTHNFKKLCEHIWSYPQVHLMVLGLTVIVWIACFSYLPHGSNTILLFSNLVNFWSFAVMAMEWTFEQFGHCGLLQLFVKWAVFIAGMVIAFDLLFDQWPWGDVTFALVMGKTADPAPAMIAVAICTVLASSRFSEWVVDKAGMKLWESGPVQAVRGCF